MLKNTGILRVNLSSQRRNFSKTLKVTSIIATKTYHINNGTSNIYVPVIHEQNNIKSTLLTWSCYELNY